MSTKPIAPTISRGSSTISRPPSNQQGPPSADAAKAEVWLRGHLGHLTEKQQAAFVAFKDLCAKEGFYKPAAAGALASHDDAQLVRFLRARRFVPQDAFIQFKDTELWRKENDLQALYEKIDIKDYRESRGVYPQWTGRRDKRGIPLYLYEVGKLDAKKMLAYSSSTSKTKAKGSAPSRMLRLFALYENLTRFVMPLCTAAPGRPYQETPVDQSNNIVDISRVGLKQFWNLKNHMQDASQLATAHYPETLDRIFILGAPSFFPTVWSWIKRWFDPITTSKIFVLSQHQVLPTLTQFIDIKDIPKKYGGQLDFQCGDLPNLDPELREHLTIPPGEEAERFLLTSPVRWAAQGADGEMFAIGVGSINGKERQEPLATLHGLVARTTTHRERLSRMNTQASVAPSSLHSVTTTGTGKPVPHSQLSHLVPAPGSSHSNRPSSLRKSIEAPPIEIAKTEAPVSSTTTSTNMNGTIPNGVLPEKLNMPPPPSDLSRQKTEYMTPAQEPEELKALA
ncbi:uncharacterized protein KY384_005379 [Bacidia gigantensis]|uniref:uncharacterized protein n=1 Tax=Bacidia gigantensis TaxID=2732470 RepID=UPI001D050A0D|nr:uncharacterized protein KY384_005379 [Bacidia gigantensis]KAG8529898.1 hypothetical protein KY384_005379 [Bacidia gigantensis]